MTQQNCSLTAVTDITSLIIWTISLGQCLKCGTILLGQGFINLGLQKKNYLDREFVPIPSDTPTIETVSEYLDS